MAFGRRFLTIGLLLGCFVLAASADDKKPAYPKHPSAENVKVIPEGWRSEAWKPVDPAEIDELLAREQKAERLNPSLPTTDEQFIRRVYLDLTGKLPAPMEVIQFANNRDPGKRGELIQRLLASDDFNRHLGRYWRDVIVARATEMRLKRNQNGFEEWFSQQLKGNRNWGEIARDMLTAIGEMRFEEGAKNGAAFFLLLHMGNDAAVERAAEASRVFLGIQVQCAQCHDHPNDIWKREQFHELTAFFARVRERPIRDGGRLAGVQLLSLPRGEHQMPGKDDANLTQAMHPRFLTGQSLGRGLPDLVRRRELAGFITAKENYWFSAAFVNRVWNELIGQAFYEPVDNLGPLQKATYPTVLFRLAASFAASDYDIRALYRTIMNTQAYQRQIRLGESADEHLHFAAAYPTRLRPDALFDSLTAILGPTQPERPFLARPAPPAARLAGGFREQFRETFSFDPSTKADEVEGSIPQALLLMNNPALAVRMKATGNTPLARILENFPRDEDAIRALYLRVLARKPTTREADVALGFVKELGNRAEAFEDLLWTLVNSTEFQTKR